jgi:hypothetical protein
MNTCSGVCHSCQKGVALFISEGAALARPALITAGSGFIGLAVGRSKDRFANGLLGLAVGGVLSLVVHALTPAAQKWVCGDCGCSNVSPGT